MVRQGDETGWASFAGRCSRCWEAEEYGITQKNVDEMLKQQSQRRAHPGRDAGRQEHGAGREWAYNAIKAVGNYSEVFERNVGKDSKLNLQRGTNALWSKGGAMYPWPIR